MTLKTTLSALSLFSLFLATVPAHAMHSAHNGQPDPAGRLQASSLRTQTTVVINWEAAEKTHREEEEKAKTRPGLTAEEQALVAQCVVQHQRSVNESLRAVRAEVSAQQAQFTREADEGRELLRKRQEEWKKQGLL